MAPDWEGALAISLSVAQGDRSFSSRMILGCGYLASTVGAFCVSSSWSSRRTAAVSTWQLNHTRSLPLHSLQRSLIRLPALVDESPLNTFSCLAFPRRLCSVLPGTALLLRSVASLSSRPTRILLSFPSPPCYWKNVAIMVQSSLLAAVAGLAASVAALDPVEAYGSKFFNKDGSQFFIRGASPRYHMRYELTARRCCLPAPTARSPCRHRAVQAGRQSHEGPRRQHHPRLPRRCRRPSRRLHEGSGRCRHLPSRRP